MVFVIVLAFESLCVLPKEFVLSPKTFTNLQETGELLLTKYCFKTQDEVCSCVHPPPPVGTNKMLWPQELGAN